MSEKHMGWKLVAKIGGQDAYYHKGRDTYAIEREHSYLGGLTDREQDILDGILENKVHQGELDYREGPLRGISRSVRLGMEGW